MGAFVVTASLLARLLAGVIAGACLLVALVMAGAVALRGIEEDPPDFHGWAEDEDGWTVPVHGPRSACWPCHVDKAAS